MKTFRLFSMAALALMMAACSSEDNEILQNTQQPGTMHFTATIASPSGDATTRTAYTEDGTTINVKWEVGDQIALVHNGVVDVAEVKTVDDVTGKATIEATITGSPLDNADVTLAYPANAVVSATAYDPFPFTPNPDIFDKVKKYQDGTLTYIQDNLDLRMGSGKLAVSGSDVTLKGSVSVSSLICIWKLTLQDNASSPLSATKLTFKNNDDTQAKATSAAKSEYYLCVVPSFIPDPSGTFSFEATVGSDTYTFSKTGLSLTAGKYYQSTVKMAAATTTRALAEATTDDIGKIAGADGNIYDTKAAAEAVATGNAVAMIAYVGSASDCTHGLAIALADESGSISWSDAGNVCSGKTAVTGGTWRLPSNKDWQYMFIGCGSNESYSEPSEGMKKSWSGLASKLEAAGGTVIPNRLFWSSTTNSDGEYGWSLGLGNGIAVFYDEYEGDDTYVRAVLAF